MLPARAGTDGVDCVITVPGQRMEVTVRLTERSCAAQHIERGGTHVGE